VIKTQDSKNVEMKSTVINISLATSHYLEVANFIIFAMKSYLWSNQ